MSGLKVNFHKSKLYGVNLETDRITEGENLLGCHAESLSLSYLGLEIGCNHHKLETWADLIQKIRNHIASWDGKKLLLSCRATLVQSSLSVVLIYNISFYILPKQVIKDLTKVQHFFLWGGDDVNSKIPRVKWSIVCKKKKYGGLGIREMGKFNRALVGKWIWRILTEKNMLWVRVLESRYGRLENMEGSLRKSGSSLWWRDLLKIY
ncbi:hypothetical protein ACS0TY_032389 [Phlomoides rotata]